MSQCGNSGDKGPEQEGSAGKNIENHAQGAGYPGAGDAADQRLVLSDHDRMMIIRRSSRGLVRVLTAQLSVAAVVVAVSGLVAGSAAALSALIGAAAYFVPNALFAMRLLFGFFGPVKTGPLTFFAGEAFKLGTAVLVLALTAWYGRDWLVWPALLFGLIGVLKGYVLLLLFRKLP